MVVVGYIMFVVSVAAPSIVEGESVVGWIVGASEVEDLTLEKMKPSYHNSLAFFDYYASNEISATCRNIQYL